MSDRVCLMNNARVEQFGTPQAIYQHPRTTFAAEFVAQENEVLAAHIAGGAAVAGEGVGVAVAGDEGARDPPHFPAELEMVLKRKNYLTECKEIRK